MSTLCSCCRRPRCLRARRDDATFEAAWLHLRDKLARQQERLLEAERASGEPVELPQARAPWEMTPAQFEVAAEPRLQPTWATPTWTGRRGASMRPGHRFMGLSRSVLPREIHFLLRCKGGPPDGYRVRVPEARPDLYEQPHRAFVEAALAEGLVVPSAAAADYNDLTSGPQDMRPSLDLPPDWANPLG